FFVQEAEQFLRFFPFNKKDRRFGWFGLTYISYIAFFRCVVKESVQLEIILLRDRIVYMIMALCAFHRHTNDGLAKCIGFVNNIFYPIFFIYHPSFFGIFMVAIKSGCQNMFFIGIGQQISS